MDVTTLLALWGALLSTVLGTWTIIRDWSDRGRIKVDASIGKMVPDHTDRDYLFITITNVGKRPILIKGWCLKRKGDGQKPYLFVVTRGLPRMLPEGEYHMEWTHETQQLTSDVTGMFVVDSAGRRWKVPRKQVRQVISEAKELSDHK